MGLSSIPHGLTLSCVCYCPFTYRADLHHSAGELAEVHGRCVEALTLDPTLVQAHLLRARSPVPTFPVLDRLQSYEIFLGQANGLSPQETLVRTSIFIGY